MIKTYGLTHLALAVRDPKASAAFYRAVFGTRIVWKDASSVQVQTPGAKDVISFERNRTAAGKAGGIIHFGFRLRKPKDIDAAVDAALRAGGRLIHRGQFKPG